MSVNLNPGVSYSVITPAERPVRNSPAPVVPAEVVTAEVVVEERANGRGAKRPEEYVAALRELQEEQPTRQGLATRTYLQVAHYEGDFPLVDVYT